MDALARRDDVVDPAQAPFAPQNRQGLKKSETDTLPRHGDPYRMDNLRDPDSLPNDELLEPLFQDPRRKFLHARQFLAKTPHEFPGPWCFHNPLLKDLRIN